MIVGYCVRRNSSPLLNKHSLSISFCHSYIISTILHQAISTILHIPHLSPNSSNFSAECDYQATKRLPFCARALSSTMNSPELSELSSDLSSVGSLSPPPEYATPPSSAEDVISSTIREQSLKRLRDGDESPPAKKRKTAEPKPRITQHLNLGLSPSSLASDQRIQLDTLLKVLRKRQKIVVIAGAGISVSAGSMCSLNLTITY